MHFRSDEKFPEPTKILEIKNKGNYRGSVLIFRRPKWHFFRIFLVPVFWKTLVQVAQSCKEILYSKNCEKLGQIFSKFYQANIIRKMWCIWKIPWFLFWKENWLCFLVAETITCQIEYFCKLILVYNLKFGLIKFQGEC